MTAVVAPRLAGSTTKGKVRAAARERDVPILLSVGYSACHWCHVMAHESFEDPETAALMNDLFVNVKVDREERPDVDRIYMDAVQAMRIIRFPESACTLKRSILRTDLRRR